MSTVTGGKVRDISEEIEQRRVLYEQTWGQPTSPGMELLLEEVSREERADLLRELLYVEFEFVQRNSSEVIIDPYLARFPDYESVVLEVANAVGQYTVFRRHIIKDFTLLDEIGRGGMGVVYRARNNLLNRYVAIKMVNRRLLDHPESRSRFLRELEMIGRFRHPNIVEAEHAGITPDGSLFLVMELVEGMTLTEWSRQNPPRETVCVQDAETTIEPGTEKNTACFEQNPTQTFRRQTVKLRTPRQMESQRIAEACAIVRDTARGLQAIHAERLVHRDIKPGNLMLTPDGRVKILDLGLAKLREQLAEYSSETEPHTLQGHLLGTPGYMAPEQMHSAAHVDIRADIYSLGCTFFFLLYGCAPTENRSQELATSLPKSLRKILDRMLAADPTSRFQEPGEIVAALDAFLDSSKIFRFGGVVAAVTCAVFVGIVLMIYALYHFHFSGSGNHDSSSGNRGSGAGKHGILLPPDPFVAKINAAIKLRHRGYTEQASGELYQLETDLRAKPYDGSDGLLAMVLSAQGDCDFYSGLASDALPEGKVKRLATWYDKALALVGESSNNELRIKLLCKQAILEGLQNSGTDDRVTASRLDTVRSLLRNTQKVEENGLDLYLHLAEAITLSGTDDQPLRNFADQFEESGSGSELATPDALDLRLFALECLIHRDIQSGREILSEDLELLDPIFSAQYPDIDSRIFLNRFFDMAIRACNPNDYAQMAKYLRRMRRQGTITGSTWFMIYFSPWGNSNGFAVYYPAERQKSRRFELPYSRSDVKKAIDDGQSLSLDETLVALIRSDIQAGVPIILIWDDTPCWSRRSLAFSNEDWPFNESITIEEMLGQLK